VSLRAHQACVVMLLTGLAVAAGSTPASADFGGTELWALRNSNSAGPASVTVPWIAGSRLACDTDGDGRDEPASYDAASGTFLLSDAPYPLVRFGARTRSGFAVCGDWDGDGRDGVGVAFPGRDGQWKWRLRNDATSGPADLRFSFLRHAEGVEYEPVVGDWDGNSTDTPGLWASGTWSLRNRNSAGTADLTFRFGGRGGKPLVGDWNGDGRTTIGTYRGSDSSWSLRNRNSAGAAARVFSYGEPEDYDAVTGDWDGDGRTTVGVIRSP